MSTDARADAAGVVLHSLCELGWVATEMVIRCVLQAMLAGEGDTLKASFRAVGQLIKLGHDNSTGSGTSGEGSGSRLSRARTHSLLTGTLAILRANRRYYTATADGIESVMALAGDYDEVLYWLQKSRHVGLWAWFEIWTRNNIMPRNVHTKSLPAGMAMRKPANLTGAALTGTGTGTGAGAGSNYYSAPKKQLLREVMLAKGCDMDSIVEMELRYGYKYGATTTTTTARPTVQSNYNNYSNSNYGTGNIYGTNYGNYGQNISNYGIQSI
jgi:hypothetical protein